MTTNRDKINAMTNEELEQAIIDKKRQGFFIGFVVSILIVALTTLLSYN